MLRPIAPTATTSRSFLKWAGGKTRIASVVAALAPDDFGTYVEPFCGSAAVFFALAPTRAVLADANEDLIVCLRAVRQDPVAVMRRLDRMPNTRRYFDKVRRQDVSRLKEIDRAARVIYLNKTAFRGLWRVNRAGGFNTPYGEYRRPYYRREVLLKASEALASAEILSADFADVLERANRGDYVYLDPPYVPDRKWGDFTRYTAGQFGPADQQRLATCLRILDQRRVRWLMTNSNTPAVRELYDSYKLSTVSTRRDITLQAADRSSTDLVIANFEHRRHPALTPLRKNGRG